MNRLTKSVLAFVAALSIPFVATAPATAAATWTPDLSTFTFDCDDHASNFGWELPIYGDSVTLEFQDCDAGLLLEDSSDTGNASTTAGNVEDVILRSVDTVTITDEMQLSILAADESPYAAVGFVKPWELPNPTGSRLATGHQDFDSSPLAATWGTPAEVSNNEEIQIGGISGCEIWPGEHIYAKQTFSVSTAGDYTFRITGVDPYPTYMSRFGGTDYALEDPMVALYSAFDSSDPSTGIVGCNDDLNDLVFGGHDYDDNAWNISEDGDYIEGHYSYFGATLEPGEYTLVFTTWGDESADEWAAGFQNSGRMYFDAWGPNGGLELSDGGSGKPSKLAETGVDAGLTLWSAMGLIGAGVIVTIARRRRDSRV